MAAHFTQVQNLCLGIGFFLLTSSTRSAAAQLVTQSAPPAGASDAVQQTVPRPSDNIAPIPIAPQPPAPALETPVAPLAPTVPNLDLRFPVQHIEVVGSTVLQPEIEELVHEYESKAELTFDELLELRSRITQLYIEHGYITSGAFLPSGQSLSDGDIKIQVVEGRLESIELCLLSPGAGRRADRRKAEAQALNAQPPVQESNSEPEASSSTLPVPSDPAQSPEGSTENQSSERECGSARLRESYIYSRLARLMDGPVNQQRIEEALQLLQLNPVIQQVNAELTAGSMTGRSILQVEVREASALGLSVGGDNYQSPSIGSEQFSIQASYANLLGLGDRVSAGYGVTQGLGSFNVGYSIPLNAMDGTLGVSYNTDDSLIIDSDFEDFKIRSESETISLSFRQPVVKTPENEVGLGISLDLRRSTSFLDGEPFSFSEGPEDGQSNVTVVRLSQDWLDRDIDTVLAARSQFSLGIEAFDATVNDTGTDGTFFAWLGQFQWVQGLSPRWVLVSRLNAQLTPDSLLPLERFGYGGVDTLRGYRQNQLVTDNGVLGSVEARFSLLPNSNHLQLIPFVDAGTGWNNRTPDPNPSTLASVGLGLRWLITPDLSVRLDYGIPLIDVKNDGNSLQDHGFYFSLRYEPF